MSIKLGSIKWWVSRLFALSCMTAPILASGAVEETFDVLHIGTRFYTNVTVTTKTGTQIFIMHSTGMHTIKVADLSPDVLAKLGYGNGSEKKSAKGLPSLGTAGKSSKFKINLPQFKQLQTQWRSHTPARFATIHWSTNALLMAGGLVIVLYLLFSFCAMLICQKAGHPPGALIWIPILQLIPLVRAAQMSPAWVIAFMIPLLNIVAHIVWSFNIAKARGKSTLTGLFLVLPVTSFFAFLYLALSNGVAKKETPTVEIMTLEAA